MSDNMLSVGRVKWYREDNTGYIESGGVKFYVDGSCVAGAQALVAGQVVRFRPVLVLGRWCAFSVQGQ